MSDDPMLLSARDLGLRFGGTTALQNVDVDLWPGEMLAILGESGSGKSTVAKLTVGLIAPSAGDVVIAGVSMNDPARRSERQRLRRRIQMVFQDPYASLNPRWRAAGIIAEPIRAFGLARRRADVAEHADELLRLVGLDPADGHKYPHEFSGGQRQRVAIARALASQPDFIVFDEPTSALDVTVQRKVLDHLQGLARERGTAVLLITHDLALAAERAEHLAVMHRGVVVFGGRFRNGGLGRSPRARRPSAIGHAVTRCCPGVTRPACELCHCRRSRRLQRRSCGGRQDLEPQVIKRYERYPEESQHLSIRRGEGSVRPLSARQAQGRR